MTALRVGLGFDVHPFAADEGGPLVLGGVRMAGASRLHGHSDADVLAHAVADALLGAAGLADLGTFFPATDDRWAGADSLVLLAAVVEEVRGAGWSVGNVDCVVVAEVPRLAPHISSMRAALEGVVGATVNVKAKRAESLGSLGRAEGIAAWATALLERSREAELERSGEPLP